MNELSKGVCWGLAKQFLAAWLAEKSPKQAKSAWDRYDALIAQLQRDEPLQQQFVEQVVTRQLNWPKAMTFSPNEPRHMVSLTGFVSRENWTKYCQVLSTTPHKALLFSVATEHEGCHTIAAVIDEGIWARYDPNSGIRYCFNQADWIEDLWHCSQRYQSGERHMVYYHHVRLCSAARQAQKLPAETIIQLQQLNDWQVRDANQDRKSVV